MAGLPGHYSGSVSFDRNQACQFRISKEDTVKAAKARRREPAFELWSVLLGIPPKINLVTQFNQDAGVGLSRLIDAHACFQGIKRPLAEDGNGEKLLAYILKPAHFYEFRPHPACVAYKADVHADLVFVAYAKLDEPCGPDGHPIKGVLTHWQFVESATENPELPIEFDTRYDRRLW
jgi:hypothetical protein